MYQNEITRKRVQMYLAEYGTPKLFFAKQCGVDRSNFTMFVNDKYDMGQRSLKLINEYIDKMIAGDI